MAVGGSIEYFYNKVVATINLISANILETKYRVQKALGDIINTGGNIWDYMTVIAWGSVQLSIKYFQLSGTFREVMAISWIAKLKTDIATFLDSIGVQLLISTHKLLLEVWTSYRDAFKSINTAAAGLSNSLGYGGEFFPLLLTNIQNVYVATSAIFGVQPQESKIKFLTTSAEYLNKWQARFDLYAQNPGAILDELNQWVLDNSELQYSSKFSSLQKLVGVLSTTVTTTVKNLETLENAVNKLINDLPDEVFARVQNWYAPIHTQITDFENTYITPAINYLDEITSELLRRSDASMEWEATWLKSFTNLPSVLVGMLFDTSAEGQRNRALLRYLIEHVGVLTETEEKENVAAWLEANIQKPGLKFDGTTYTPQPLPPPVPKKPIPEPPPMVGSVFGVASQLVAERGINSIIGKITGIVP